MPYDESSRAMLIRLLHESQHLDEASQQYQIGLRMLKEAGVVSTGALLRARVGGKSGSAVPPAEPPEQHTRYDPGVRAVTESLIGRDEEVKLLADAMSGAASDSLAQVIVVRGEPGIG